MCTGYSLSCWVWFTGCAQIGIVCKHLGIKDIIAKVIGSHDPHNTLHATFLALQNVIPPDELSELRGRAVEVY
jgi:ribosomal protein S5